MSLLPRRRTTGYPAVPEPAPPNYRGMPELDTTRCDGNAACADVCPSEAIEVERPASDSWRWRLDRARCIGCGACLDACRPGAIAISPAFELAVRDRAELVTTVRFAPGRPPGVDETSPISAD